MRRRLAALTVLLCILGAGATGCSDDGGSKEEICAALPDTPDLESVVADLDTAEPDELDSRLSNAAKQFRELERAAPDEIHDEVQQVSDAVQEILDVVQDHLDDREALRTELASRKAELLDVGPAAQRLVDYARDTCGIDLGS